MSKLTHVREALKNNLNITIVAALEQNYLPSKSGYWSHTVDFYVAPKNGCVSTANELQALMMSLVPGLELSCKDNFTESDIEIKFGKLYFDEYIGTRASRLEIILTDSDMFSTKGFVDGKYLVEKSQKVERRTWVSLFPSVQIATAALEGKNQYSISKSQLF
ncbi:MAG: hypothetical protein KBC50_01465 [Candidatus Pacebacteria bacterium]|nr:hypothetical protein [Candidatus Paceibacterota bacterium]